MPVSLSSGAAFAVPQLATELVPTSVAWLRSGQIELQLESLNPVHDPHHERQSNTILDPGTLERKPELGHLVSDF